MKILVTNDDGFEAKGISELVEILRPYGDLTVVAPKKPQSGMSMAVSMGLRPIAVRKLSEKPGERWWYLDGTPASCIKYGIDNIFWPERPDLVVSGINHGSNAATAALTFKSDADFSAVRRLLPEILDKLLDVAKPRSGMFYNINFPYIPHDRIKGVRMCRMGKAHWEREYRPYLEFLSEIGKTPDPDAEKYLASCLADEQIYVMAGDFTSNDGNPDDADHLLLEQGYITVTPHNIDNTDSGEYERLCAII